MYYNGGKTFVTFSNRRLVVASHIAFVCHAHTDLPLLKIIDLEDLKTALLLVIALFFRLRGFVAV